MLFSMKSRFIKKLKNKKGIWRVDGIESAVLYGNNRSRITVCFSEIIKDSLESPYQSPALTGNQCHLEFHSSYLYLFNIGSVWREGKKLRSTATLKKLIIDTRQARFIRLNESVKLNNINIDKIVPNNMFKLDENFDRLEHNLCALLPVIKNSQTDWLVIPASELYRFYIGVSTSFCNAGLTGDFGQYVDWSLSNYDEISPVIFLKKRLSLLERSILIRALASENAKSCLSTPHKYLSKTCSDNNSLDNNNKKPLIIKASFPFSGLTTLTVTGKPMRLTDKNDSKKKTWSFFAMEILNCSHRETINYPEIIHNYDPRSSSSPPSGGASMPRAYSDTPENDEQELNDETADARYSRLGYYNYSNRFSYINRITYIHKRPVSKTSPNTYIHIDVDDDDGRYTLEDGSYENEAKGNRGENIHDSNVQNASRKISQFVEMLQHLRSLTNNRNWKIKTLALNDKIIHGRELIALFPYNIEKYRWHRIKDADNPKRTLQIVWVEIYTEKKEYIYLFEMELKDTKTGRSTLILNKYDYSKMSDDMFLNLLTLTTVRNGWPLPNHLWKKKTHKKLSDNFFKEIQVNRIRHQHLVKNNKLTKNNEKKLSNETDITLVTSESWAESFLNNFDDIFT